MDLSEAAVVAEVKEVLKATGLQIQRINTGCFGARHVKTANKGTLDFEGYDNRGRFVGIECKRPVVGRVSTEQADRISDINLKGGVAFIATSGVEAMEKLKENGCL